MNPAGTVRFCVWYSYRMSGVAEPDDPTKKPLLTGGLGRSFNTFLDFMYHGSPVHFNHSIVKLSEFGSERGDGSLTGCAGSIQRNESDFLIGLALYPFDDYDRVFQAQVMEQDRVTMLSAYNKTNETMAGDTLVSASRAFSQKAYVIMLMSVIMISLLLKGFWFVWKREVRTRKNLCVVYETIANFMQQDEFDIMNLISERWRTTCWSIRILLLSLSILSFFTLITIGNFISTESVVVKKPDVINTYEDFLARPHVLPYFLNLTSDSIEFQEAPAGSPARKIWNRLSNSPTNHGSHLISSPSVSVIIQCTREISKGRGVSFLSSLGVDFAIRRILNIFLVYPRAMQSRLRIWRSVDPSSRIKERGMIIRPEFAFHTIEGRHFLKQSRRMFEMGWNLFLMRETKKGMTFYGDQVPDYLIEEFASRTVKVDMPSDDDYRAFKVHDLKSTFLISLIGLFAAGVVSWMEMKVINLKLRTRRQGEQLKKKSDKPVLTRRKIRVPFVPNRPCTV